MAKFVDFRLTVDLKSEFIYYYFVKNAKKSSIESVFQKVQELFIKSRTSEEMDRNTQIDNVQVQRTQNSLLRSNNIFFSFLWSAPAIS